MKRILGEYLRGLPARTNMGSSERVLLRAISFYRKIRDALGQSDNDLMSRAYLRWKHAEQELVSWKYKFVTVEELLWWTSQWVQSFPAQYDVIVGIPRSGLLVANMVALKLGRPLTTPELFQEGRYWTSVHMERPRECRRVLLIDDSVSSGETLLRNLAVLRAAKPGCEVTTGAVIVTPEAKSLVDLYYREISQPRLFEWNMLHVKKGVLASDLDGVICENCPAGVDADEALYTTWIRRAKPYLIPSFELDFIISSRLEHYRPDTEDWLARHGVKYGQLLLWDIASKQEAKGGHARHKIGRLLRLKPEMFWESSLVQAREIWQATKIPTLCVDEMKFFA